MRKVYLDFEYNQTSERYQNLVACALQVVHEDQGQASTEHYQFWLDRNESEKRKLREGLLALRGDSILVAFNVVAEASSLISLRLDPTKFKWIDLQLEYKMLLNHNHKFMYGDQLIKGRARKIKAPKKKWEMSERELLEADSSKPEKSLAAACFKLLGKNIDLEHKNQMRDLILSEPKVWDEADRKAVMDYCLSDVTVLPDLEANIFKVYANHPIRHAGLSDLEHLLWRGESAARAALIEKTGYPVSDTAVRNFAKSVPSILNDICKDINDQFPDKGYFEWNRKTGSFTMKQAPFQDFIKSTPFAAKWLKTETGKFSLSLDDGWGRHYSYRHDYPRGNLPAQIIRFLKTKQSVNGFRPKPKTAKRERRTFFDSYGSDGRARCWLNPYGSQSSRFQPQATGFIPLKSAWMRSLIQPKPGFSICSIDYASEEFLLAALLSKDRKMYESYASGDPYLHFAKLAKAVPPEGTKETHPLERLRFKSTVLGISYLMGNFSLAVKLTQDTGQPHTPEDAQELIDLYFSVYDKYRDWIADTQSTYEEKGYLALLDGWVMFGDNDNFRSVSNCPIQGAGACILRRAIKFAQDAGLRVIIPLHDALYIEYPSDKPEKIDQLAEAMMQAFGYHFERDRLIFTWSQSIRLDIDAWGSDLPDGQIVTPKGRSVKTQKIYVDPRAKTEYERFSRYFTSQALPTHKERNHAAETHRA